MHVREVARRHSAPNRQRRAHPTQGVTCKAASERPARSTSIGIVFEADWRYMPIHREGRASMTRVVPSQVVKIIEDLFPRIKVPEPLTLRSGQIPELLTVVRLVHLIPNELLTVPVEEFARLRLAIEVIEESVRQAPSQQYMFQIRDINGQSAVGVIWNVLRQCPDEFPSTTFGELCFIDDGELRTSIANDIGAIRRAIRNSEWKAANVLAGAVIEALLLWYLLSIPAQQVEEAIAACLRNAALKIKPDSKLEKWPLRPMIEVATHLKKLSPHTAIEARQCNNFRNLIHPGKGLRTGTLCNLGTAYSAVAALDFVVRDLQ